MYFSRVSLINICKSVKMSLAASFQSRAERLQLRTGKGALAVDLVSAVTGKLSTRQPIALPPHARVVVRVEDVSRADARAPVIGEQTFATGGRQAPLAFEVPFDPADIDPRHSYAIAARITDADGTLLFVTATAHLVITRNGPTQGVEVTLDPAKRHGPRRGPP